MDVARVRPCLVPDCPGTVPEAVCSTICWWPQIRRLNGAWPELIAPVQFAVEDVPPSDPAPWEDVPHLGSQSFPAGHGIPPRIVLYRMPLQSHARNRMDLQFAIRDEVVSRLAEIYGRRPEEIDPDWGM